jgi:hypothetical protein
VDQLKGKNRRRRKDLARMTKAEASPRALRNDLLPRLELAHVPLERLKMPAREGAPTDRGGPAAEASAQASRWIRQQSGSQCTFGALGISRRR